MKIAFITHSDGMGGAEQSASTCIQYLFDKTVIQPEDCKLICPKYLIERFEKVSSPENDRYFQIKKNVATMSWYLPFGLVYRGASEQVLSKGYSMVMGGLSWILFLHIYNRKLKETDIIHLNSITLWSLLPIIPKRIKKVIHIRETINDTLESKVAVWAINKFADNIIAIDSECAKPFPRSVIIHNPIDMTIARALRNDRNNLKTSMGIPSETFIVTVVAPISKLKGFDFLIRVLKKFKKDGVLFLVVGSEPYSDHYTTILKQFPNVILAGYQKDTSKFYAITDVVIRCEDYFALGRTVWEGLFAGCMIMIPYPTDIHALGNVDTTNMVLYHTGDVIDFINRIADLVKVYPHGIDDTGYPRTNSVEESSIQFKKELIG